MRQLPAIILGFMLLVAPVRSATNAPGEAELEAKLQAVTKEKERLEAELNTAKSKPSGSIIAEVHGMLKKDDQGYYILTRIEGGAELRVWLQAYTPTVQTTYRDLINKDVIAKGQIFQNEHVVSHTTTKVPARGMYFRTPNIRAANPPIVTAAPTVALSPAFPTASPPELPK